MRSHSALRRQGVQGYGLLDASVGNTALRPLHLPHS
jgi:hypothetical protein